jgi:membrane protein DedA with SNARE-associated domain
VIGDGWNQGGVDQDVNGTTAALLVLFVVAVVPLLPTEVTLLGMGVTTAQDGTTLLPVILVGAAGCLVSDLLLYAVGRSSGPRMLTRMRRRPKIDAGVGWVDERLREHPRPVLVVARWLPSGGTIGALLAGSLRWPMTTFVTASAIGVTLWTSYVAVLGYVGGQIAQEPGISMLFSLGIATLLGSAITIALKHQRRNADTMSEVSVRVV